MRSAGSCEKFFSDLGDLWKHQIYQISKWNKEFDKIMQFRIAAKDL